MADDASQTINVSVPLFIRLLEYAREDVKADLPLHQVAERATEMMESKPSLDIDCYNKLVGSSSAKDAATYPPIVLDTEAWRR